MSMFSLKVAIYNLFWYFYFKSSSPTVCNLLILCFSLTFFYSVQLNLFVYLNILVLLF